MAEVRIIEKPELHRLVARLRADGYTVVGPTLAQGAIVLDELTTADQLPIGWTDIQEKGMYRLQRRDDRAYFGYAVGPHSWKKYLFPPRLTLLTIEKTGGSFAVRPGDGAPPRYAFLGVRSCDLHAIAVQDRTFLHGPHPDPHYKVRREQALVIAVNCGVAAATCFCASMGTGPKAEAGFDLALTELPEAFLVEVGSARGEALLASLERGTGALRTPCAQAPPQPPLRKAGSLDISPASEGGVRGGRTADDAPRSATQPFAPIASRAATAGEVAEGNRVVEQTARSMTRRLDPSDMPALLYDNLEHSRWDDVAGRCLSCTNCTMVCPTCFCHSVEDVPELDAERTSRVRQWDSCFNPEYSHVAGGSTRPEIRARYRQWLTHKLASWIDQFGVSGCVGCGRCITWCPVGIDLTEEVAAIRGRSEA